MCRSSILKGVVVVYATATSLAAGPAAQAVDSSNRPAPAGEIVYGSPAADGIPAPGDSRFVTAAGDLDASGRIRITESRGYWTSFMGGGGFLLQPESDPFETRGGLFVMAGRLQNTSDAAIEHVELLFELLDAEGEVVASRAGFNHKAEALFDDPETRESAQIEAIAAGESDSYRMIFFGDEVPRFETSRVSVLRAGAVPR